MSIGFGSPRSLETPAEGAEASPEGAETSHLEEREVVRGTPLRLGHLLGTGRHGMVFLATTTSPELPAALAVKVPNRPDGLVPEKRALQRFSHPGIVSMIDIPTPNGALVLEHCDLGTLADRLHEERLSVAELTLLADALVPAVGHLHASGWIHGDISPANIGLRSGKGPVLLDFATARAADGQAIAEGTAEFAGPLRQADPRLDIRSLAATLSAALGAPDRWDHKKRAVRTRLMALIARCDADQPVELGELLEIVCEPNSVSAHAGTSGGGPVVNPSTRAFGPPPTATAPSVEHRATPRRLVAAAVVLVALIVAGGLEIALGARPNNDHVEAMPILVEEISARSTVQDAEATWDSGTGILTTSGPEGRSFAAGEPGDVAAIADWDCDGSKTLAVFRPSTGALFVFDSWTDRTVARAREVGPGETLLVQHDESGCPTPVVRSAHPIDE